MSKYFFNVVLNGQPTVDGKGRHFVDDSVARAHACHLAMLLADCCQGPINSFVAVSRLDGRLAFKVPFGRPDHKFEVGSSGSRSSFSKDHARGSAEWDEGDFPSPLP